MSSEAPDIYVFKDVTEDNQPIYFGLEKITTDNQGALKKYLECTSNACTTQYKENYEIVPTIYYVLGSIISDNKIPYDEIKSCGITEKQYNELLLIKDSESLKKTFKAVSAITKGSGYLDTTLGKYFAYISRKPIEGPITFAVGSQEEYWRGNQHLLIMVGTDLEHLHELQAFLNRGIFKPPQTVLKVNGDYKKLSMRLHAFVSAVAEKYFNKKFMRLLDTSQEMEVIIDKRLNEVLIEDRDYIFPYSRNNRIKKIKQKVEFKPTGDFSGLNIESSQYYFKISSLKQFLSIKHPNEAVAEVKALKFDHLYCTVRLFSQPDLNNRPSNTNDEKRQEKRCVVL